MPLVSVLTPSVSSASSNRLVPELTRLCESYSGPVLQIKQFSAGLRGTFWSWDLLQHVGQNQNPPAHLWWNCAIGRGCVKGGKECRLESGFLPQLAGRLVTSVLLVVLSTLYI